MRPLVILVAGDPIPRVRAERGGYADLIRAAGAGAWPGQWYDVDFRDGSPLPDPRDVAGFVITGSSSSVVDREPWVLRGEEYLRRAVNEGTNIFGICFGHQMLGQALGGRVVRNPRGREIGTVELELCAEDPLFDFVVPPHRVNATHVDTLQRLPNGANVLARTELEPHAAVRFGETVWGVQFHPEMDAAIVRAYIDARHDLLAHEGLDPQTLAANVDDAASGAATVVRFVEIVRRCAESR